MAGSNDNDLKIASWLGECRDLPLDGYDSRYVDLDAGDVAVRGDDRKLLLFDAVDLADLNNRDTTCQLFSGYRGSGKSTELARLKLLLEEAGYLVLLSDARGYHSLTRDLKIEEMLPLVAGAFGEAAEELLQCGVLAAGWWDRLHEFLEKEVKLELTAKMGPIELKPALRGDESFLVQLHDRLTGRLHFLAECTHAFVKSTATQLRKKFPDKRGVVFIFDNLEKLSGPDDEFHRRMQSVEQIFSEHASYMRLPTCHTIYTVPLYLEFLSPRLTEAYDAPLQVLPTVRVTGRAPERERWEHGVNALRHVLARRLPLSEVFGNDAQIERLILRSAGHLRSLLDMVYDALIRSRRRGLPMSDETVDTAIARFCEKRRAAVRMDGVALLDSVRRNNSLRHVRDDDLRRLAHYLDSHLILCYRNGEGWYDVHPCIHDHVAELASEAASSEAATGETS